MIPCPSCGAENPAGKTYCGECGAKLATASTPSREVRKTVTVLFTDVTGSTALGEQFDPETLRAVLGQYFGAMKGVIERHGGTVEKFIGDAVMAVFGIPILHEDDALRAVRAAAEMREAIERLNRDLEVQRGVRIVTRTGVNTGEVVAGDPSAGQTLVTGDAVNTAARLEQAAQPGEILLGEPTHRLVRDAVTVKPVEPVSAKGKSLAVPAYRLLSVRGGVEGRSRRLDAPLVGREREIGRLRDVFETALRDRSCHLFTLLGTAGVGKSRLTAEFLASVAGEAQVLKGRCLPYGEGITYWPLGEVVRAAAAIEESDSADHAQARLRSLLAGERDAQVIAGRLASAIGLSLESAPQEDIFWATRKLLERLAREQPLVVLWEDIHWAEPTFLDLIEHIADLSREAALLLLCPARPELLDTRTTWGGGKLNATTVLLEPLPPEATERLIESLPGGRAVPAGLRARILEAAEGNPLYLEEMLAMLLEEGLIAEAGDGWQAVGDLTRVRVPPSIHALLAARLDQLAPDERAIAEHASVVGRVFEQAAVAELASESLRPSISRGLVALVRKELVRPERSDLSAGDAFKFRHILIRDAAYEALPKKDRAELHERFAHWVERVTGEREGEYSEVIGYHLEQAYRYGVELSSGADRLVEIRTRAARWLARSGRESLNRGDMAAATVLLRRAIDVLGEDDADVGPYLLDLVAGVLAQGGAYTETLAATIAELRVHLRRFPDPFTEAAAELGELVVAARRGNDVEVEPIRALIGRLSTFGDSGWLSRAWNLLAVVLDRAGDALGSLETVEQAVEIARRVGDRVAAGAALANLVAGYEELLPADEALARIGEIADSPGVDRRVVAQALLSMAYLRAVRGEFELAHSMVRQAREGFNEIGRPDLAARTWCIGGSIELVAGRPEAAERETLEVVDSLVTLGDDYARRWAHVVLAEALYRQHRLAEADTALAGMAEGSDSLGVAVLMKRAKIAAARRSPDASALAADALAAIPPAEEPSWRAELLLDYAAAVAPEDRTAAASALREAASLYHELGYMALVDTARRLEDEFAGTSPRTA